MRLKGKCKVKDYAFSIRTHLILMIVLCGGTWFVLNNVVLKQQHKALAEYRDEKAKLEYDYLRIKNYPDYTETIKKSLERANAKLDEFLWLSDGYDPNLTLFRHIAFIADASGVQITGFQPFDRGDEKYYIWDISFKGDISGVLRLINGIERSRKFLRIESVEIGKSEDGISVILTISGLKKLG